MPKEQLGLGHRLSQAIILLPKLITSLAVVRAILGIGHGFSVVEVRDVQRTLASAGRNLDGKAGHRLISGECVAH